MLLLETLLDLCRKRAWLAARGRQRTDSTHVLAVIHGRTRVETVRETLRHTLDVLAEAAPAWLLEHIQPDWAERYQRGWADDRLPSKQAERDALVAQVRADGLTLLSMLDAEEAPPTLRRLGAVQRQVWIQNYLPAEQGVRWRTPEDGLPPSRRFTCSLYDPRPTTPSNGPHPGLATKCI